MSEPPAGASRSRIADGLTIRAAAAADAERLAHVHRESWRTTYGGILPAAVIERHAGRKSESAWRAQLAAEEPPGATWLAQHDTEGIVGFASCGPAREPIEGLEAEIYALYVLQAHQRRGIGTQLVRTAARHFVRQGIFGFYLWVLRSNRARMFYEALGGQEIAERTESLGGHPFGEIAFGWHDLTNLIVPP